MNPEQLNVGVEEQKHPVFTVTPLSKYLAMVIFVTMPFVGGYIGYLSAPEKVVYLENTQEFSKALTASETLALCGRQFSLVNQSYINGVKVAEKIAQLLSEESGGDYTSEESACYWILSNAKYTSDLQIMTEPVRYDYTPVTSENPAEAYLVSFKSTDSQIVIGEGNLIDKETLEVFRVNEMDGSKGSKLGKLDE